MGNADVVRKGVEAMIAGDIEGLGAQLADDFVLHFPGTNQLSATYKGKQDFLENFIGKAIGLTEGNFQMTAHDFLGSDDHAVGIYEISAARGANKLTWRQVNVYHVANGKIVEAWAFPGDFEAWNAFWS